MFYLCLRKKVQTSCEMDSSLKVYKLLNCFPLYYIFSKYKFDIFQIENGMQNGHGNHWNVTLSPDNLAEELQQCKVIHRTRTNLSQNTNETVDVREEECTKWEYDTSQFTATIVSKVHRVSNLYLST